ncbi:hypothetical protein CYD26_01300 [Pseudomonas sp. FFUP_PS_473]|uniref:hypothetical protein n=1 Tax=Pseudomonas sp. FFUP_PS_473 TaxID=2060418 RepID=UPI000C7E5341|nr:hypothetical protein [Pseudomonas sp. FFUP_PS_473]PLP96167.1 hypothetical protein CYD26_01300 [Pseudomonas sp. FFUP_PS_473]
MHPAMQERAEGLAALDLRAHLTPTDFYAKIGRHAPALEPRFQTTNKGKMWHIIDRATGKTCSFCGNYPKALRVADAMEAAEQRKLVPRQ